MHLIRLRLSDPSLRELAMPVAVECDLEVVFEGGGWLILCGASLGQVYEFLNSMFPRHRCCMEVVEAG